MSNQIGEGALYINGTELGEVGKIEECDYFGAKEKGLHLVDATVKLIIEMAKVNRLVGYEKFPITNHLCGVVELIKKYGIGKAPIHDMQLMVLDDMEKRLLATDIREDI